MAEGSSVNELDVAIGELIAQSKADPTLAQLMAVDASAMLGRGQQLQAEIAGKGFFKRLWSSLSGKTVAASRATTEDLIKMQDLSWRYLQALQAQGLLELRTLAVIRANLAQLARTDLRTMQLMGPFVDRIEELSKRQDVLERQVSAHSWVIRNSVRDKNLPTTLRALRIGIEYGLLVGEDEASQLRLAEGYEITRALLDAGVDPARPLDAQDYLDQVIEYHLDGTLWEVMSSIQGLTQDELHHLRQSQVASATSDWVIGVGSSIYETHGLIEHIAAETRPDVLRAAVAQQVGTLSGSIALKDFCTDVAATISLARSSWKATLSIEKADVAPVKAKANEIFARRIPIKSHVLAAEGVSADVRALYPYSFALIFDEPSEVSSAHTNFLASLAKTLGASFDDARFAMVAGDHEQFSIDAFLDAIAQNEEHKTAWLVDAVALISLRKSGFTTEQGQRIRQAATALDISNRHLDIVVPQAIVLMSATAPREVLEAVQDLAATTNAWKAILSYRRLSFVRVLDEECTQLADLGVIREGLLDSLAAVLPESSSTFENWRKTLMGDGLKGLGASGVLAGALSVVSLPVSLVLASTVIAGGVVYDKTTGSKIAPTMSNEEVAGMISAIRTHAIAHRALVAPLLELVRAFGGATEGTTDAWNILDVVGDRLRRQAEDKNGALAGEELAEIRDALVKLQTQDENLIREVARIEQS